MVALVALVAVLVPAGLASGHIGEIVAGDEFVVYLTLGNQDEVTFEGQTQTITTRKNDCVAVSFADTPSLLSVGTQGGALGEVKDGLGVQSPADGSGEPCGRVEADDGEAISVALGADMGDYLMHAVDVDLELKFNAVVNVFFFHEGAEVASATFNPGVSSDDGPDSKDGDNYRFYYAPANGEGPIYFDQVVFAAGAGAFSLEGGADLSTNDDPSAFGMLDPTSKSSQFGVVEVFDGLITCGDLVTIQDDEIPDVLGEVTMHSMFFDPEGDELDEAWYVQGCLAKLYNDGVFFDSLFFIPELEGTQARYTIRITADNQVISNDSEGQITSLSLQYNAQGEAAPLQAVQECLGQPHLDPLGDPEGYEAFWTSPDVGLLPFGETACFYQVSLTTTGDGLGTEIWDVYFEDDPSFSFK